MTRAAKATSVAISITAVVLLWISMPTVRAAVPTWIIVDGLVAQVVILTAISGMFVRNP